MTRTELKATAEAYKAVARKIRRDEPLTEADREIALAYDRATAQGRANEEGQPWWVARSLRTGMTFPVCLWDLDFRTRNGMAPIELVARLDPLPKGRRWVAPSLGAV